MKLGIKILIFIALISPTTLVYSQNSYCPEFMLLLQKYKSKAYNDAKLYLDTVLLKCPDQKNEPYFWHLSGFTYLTFSNTWMVNLQYQKQKVLLVPLWSLKN